MIAMTKKEFKLQFATLWQMGLVTLGMFVLGEIILAIIMATANAEDGFTLGWLFAMMGFAFWLFCVGAQIVIGIDNAISMSRTRKSYLFAHYLVNLTYTAVMMAAVWLLGQIELLVWRTFWPGLPFAFNFTDVFDFKLMAIIVVGGVVVASFLGALLARFGKKAFWVLWTLWMMFFLVLPRLLPDSDEGTTLLSMAGAAVGRMIQSLPPIAWQALGSVGLVVCFVLTLVFLRKQRLAH